MNCIGGWRQSSMLHLGCFSACNRPCCVKAEAVSRKNNRPARRRAHKLWKQQKKQQQQWQSMTQKQHVWFEVVEPLIAPEGSGPGSSSSSSSNMRARSSTINSIIGGSAVGHQFWVEHRRSLKEQEEYRQTQLQHQPTPKQRSSTADLLLGDMALQQLNSNNMQQLNSNDQLLKGQQQQQQQCQAWPEVGNNGGLQNQLWKEQQQQQQQQQQSVQPDAGHSQQVVQVSQVSTRQQQQQKPHCSGLHWQQQLARPVLSSEKVLMDLYALQAGSSGQHRPRTNWQGLERSRRPDAGAGADKQVVQQQQQMDVTAVSSSNSWQPVRQQRGALPHRWRRQKQQEQNSSSQEVHSLDGEHSSIASRRHDTSRTYRSLTGVDEQPDVAQYASQGKVVAEVAHMDDDADMYMDDDW